MIRMNKIAFIFKISNRFRKVNNYHKKKINLSIETIHTALIKITKIK